MRTHRIFKTLVLAAMLILPAFAFSQTTINSPAFPNGVYLGGVDQNAIARPMIGMNSAGVVAIDPDSRGTRVVGNLTISGTTTHTGTVTNTGNMTVGGTLSVTGAAAFGATVAVATFTGATSAHVCYDAGAAVANTLATCTSLTALKQNIADQVAESAVQRIVALHPISFQFKPNSTTGIQSPPQYGFLAEEVEQVDPLMSTYYKGELNGVNYDAVVSVLVKAVQEQQRQIDALTGQIQTMQDNMIQVIYVEPTSPAANPWTDDPLIIYNGSQPIANIR